MYSHLNRYTLFIYNSVFSKGEWFFRYYVHVFPNAKNAKTQIACVVLMK